MLLYLPHLSVHNLNLPLGDLAIAIEYRHNLRKLGAPELSKPLLLRWREDALHLMHHLGLRGRIGARQGSDVSDKRDSVLLVVRIYHCGELLRAERSAKFLNLKEALLARCKSADDLVSLERERLLGAYNVKRRSLSGQHGDRLRQLPVHHSRHLVCRDRDLFIGRGRLQESSNVLSNLSLYTLVSLQSTTWCNTRYLKLLGNRFNRGVSKDAYEWLEEGGFANLCFLLLFSEEFKHLLLNRYQSSALLLLLLQVRRRDNGSEHARPSSNGCGIRLRLLTLHDCRPLFLKSNLQSVSVCGDTPLLQRSLLRKKFGKRHLLGLLTRLELRCFWFLFEL